jgi:hypothetical protein
MANRSHFVRTLDDMFVINSTQKSEDFGVPVRGTDSDAVIRFEVLAIACLPSTHARQNTCRFSKDKPELYRPGPAYFASGFGGSRLADGRCGLIPEREIAWDRSARADWRLGYSPGVQRRLSPRVAGG